MMAGDLELIAPGSEVVIEPNIAAKVTAIMIEGVSQHCSYKLAWWNGSQLFEQ